MIEILSVEGVGPVELSVSERGSGRPVLLLHGGAGPASVAAWAELFARTQGVRVITPTHPGFAGTPRPETLRSISGLAELYAALLDKLRLNDVIVVGNSIGGWIAAELALAAPSQVGGLVIVDGVGIVVPGHPVADAFTLPFEEIRRRSYHDPSRFVIDLANVPPAQKAVIAGNQASLKAYAGGSGDPSLRERLASVKVPTLVVWGESDRIADADYGRAFANAIPGAVFELMAETGHVPQIETPERLVEVLGRFVERQFPANPGAS